MTFLNFAPLFAQAGDDAAAAEAAGIIAAIMGMLCAMMIPIIIIVVVAIIGMWKVFAKANKPGWAAIVPIYNFIVLAEIIGRPIWWGIVAALVPCIQFVFIIIMMMDLAKSFGKGAGFGIGLALLGFIFFPILGFGSAKYQGPSVQSQG